MKRLARNRAPAKARRSYTSISSGRNKGCPGMKVGTLEVLLVNAEGIRHTNVVGKPAFYVIVHCGTQQYTSKVSSGERHKAIWNEKFVFTFPSSEWSKLTHIKFVIMDKEFFTKGGFVGETIIHLGGIITEGTDRGSIIVKPAAKSVVLEDDTYKGEISVGFKFIADKEVNAETEKSIVKGNESKESKCSSILNLCKHRLWNFFSFYHPKDSKIGQTES